MMEINIQVENIRCSGCINTITKKLMCIEGVTAVDIQLEAQRVIIEAESESIKELLIDRLVKLGYPEKGSVSGIEALKGKAKSVVSCAVGKI